MRKAQPRDRSGGAAVPGRAEAIGAAQSLPVSATRVLGLVLAGLLAPALA